ncbi:30S ribosomal protein S18 [Rickettsiales endosymbiont of Stachyamoeba lipophora]|uniref:30S ribosomal protein S18 n=1 Tax=Rickettsiales endosymbiont of Stachyamoeba lipophora TaxID=2486578 RepID=UPI000F64C435|nr:30S ribosomal protein S18 [Rickettsiales endosymbiont of Stachyamoeba lipophora]AZL15471.1 30S ribosomal protein S18 [Rickettsiales endosymbiont of Stachyamoeba lipophora]
MSNATTEKANVPYLATYKRPFFKRKRGCPLKGQNVDYKNISLLTRFISERGRILPKRITGVSSALQRKLKLAIKRARVLALLPFKSV